MDKAEFIERTTGVRKEDQPIVGTLEEWLGAIDGELFDIRETLKDISLALRVIAENIG